MKMFEGELTKLDGQQIMLEQQKMTIQSTAGDYEVIFYMKEANEKIKEMNEVVNADTVAEVQENLAENMQQVEERQDLFAAAAEEGKDDLLAELDELEADALAEGLEDMEVNNAPISALANLVPAAGIQPAAAQNEDQQEMDMLAAVMTV